MFSNFIVWCNDNIDFLNSFTGFLIWFSKWAFILIAIYCIVMFCYNLYNAWDIEDKEKFIKDELIKLWKFILIPFIWFVLWMIAWITVTLFSSSLLNNYSFLPTFNEENNPFLFPFVWVCESFNLIFFLLWALLIEFSFGNKKICKIWVIVWLLWFIFPVLAHIFSRLYFA